MPDSTIYTDEFPTYNRLGMSGYTHKRVNHGDKVWVIGDAHTNTIESFWALLKRGIVGQYHKVSLRYLPRYITEFCYRYNHRKHVDLFTLTIHRGLGVL